MDHHGHSKIMRDLVLSPFTWFKTLFEQCNLFKEFVKRDIKGRFAGSFGGFSWALINPIAQILIYIFIFSIIFKVKLSRLELGTESFAVYLLASIFQWLAFSEGISRAAGVLVEHANLITKVVFAIEILPAVSVSSAFLLNGLGFALVLVWLAAKGYLAWSWLWVPLISLLFWGFSIGFAAFLAALTVFLRDTQQALGTILTIWFYFTPILYPLSMVPSSLRTYMRLNPLFSFIELYHQALLQRTIDGYLFLAAFSWTIFTLFLGLFFFKRLQLSFGDVL